MRTYPGVWVLVLSFFVAPVGAHATEFAVPPDDPVIVQDYERDRDWPDSVARLQIGPALDVSTAQPGLFLALDLGRRNIGFRLAGSAIALGRADGTAIGSAELWVRPIELGAWSAILGTGAGLRDESHGRGAPSGHELAGVAVFRGGLELRLPIREADARAGLSLSANVPAIMENGDESARTSALLAAGLAIGF